MARTLFTVALRWFAGVTSSGSPLQGRTELERPRAAREFRSPLVSTNFQWATDKHSSYRPANTGIDCRILKTSLSSRVC